MSVTETGGGLDDDIVCRWLITAGFQPGSSAERFTEAYVVTDEEWGGGDVAGRRLRTSREQEAVAYASRLMSDQALAWVRLDYRSRDGATIDEDG